MTTYEYDDRGRMVRSAPEVEWDPEQRGWMLALAEYRAGLCPHCGRPRRVCTDPESEGKWEVPTPDRCHATTALHIKTKQYVEQPQSGALLYHAERR